MGQLARQDQQAPQDLKASQDRMELMEPPAPRGLREVMALPVPQVRKAQQGQTEPRELRDHKECQGQMVLPVLQGQRAAMV